MSYEKRFKELVAKYIKREGIKDLMDALDNYDFYTAPASTRHHDAHEGGLVKHSVAVFDRLVSECGDKYPMETIAIVALFHDLCKMGYYKSEMRNTKSEQGRWIQVPYYTVDDAFPIGHGEKSVILLMQHIKLTADEVLAIRWHMNGFEANENYQYISKAYSTCPLALLLAVADLKATYFDANDK